MITRVLVVALLLVAGCGGEEERRAARADPVLAALRDGGLTLVMRHAITDATTGQQERLRSCALQRNLTGAGREQARRIGEAIQALRIPIAAVRASPLCRTRDTARLAFGRVEIDRDLVSPGILGTEADDLRRARILKARAASSPGRGANTVLVTHTGNIGAAFGEETVEEGETLLYGPGGRLVGRVRAEQWASLGGPPR